MFENCVTLSLVLSKLHKSIRLIQVSSDQILTRLAIEALRQFNITHVPLTECLLHVSLDPLDSIIGKYEPMPHNFPELDDHFPVIEYLHLELVVVTGEGLPPADTLVDLGNLFLVDEFL